MKIAIIGFGREGKSILNYYTSSRLPTPSQKEGEPSEIWVLDKNPSLSLKMTGLNIKTQLGEDYLKNLDWFDLIFRSPGVPYNNVAPQLRPRTNLTSATKLFFEKCPCKIIGITGTKGKGTTATLLFNILKECGRDVYLAGNIGVPALDILPKLKKDSLVVLELSSFQLQDLKQSPPIAIVLDIFPDHLDVHKNYEEYIEAKKNIYRYQKPNDKVFFAKDCYSPMVIGLHGDKRGNKLQIPGEHNLKNATMAYQVAKYLNCPEEKIKKAIWNFKGMEHRLEFVKEIGGVKYYNDSASTNPLTTLAAVKSFKEPKILIIGGVRKGLDYSVWKKEFTKHNIKVVIEISKDLERAVIEARDVATAGDVVLFSPGAASFDLFKDYADRGQKFKKLVSSL